MKQRDTAQSQPQLRLGDCEMAGRFPIGFGTAGGEPERADCPQVRPACDEWERSRRPGPAVLGGRRVHRGDDGWHPGPPQAVGTAAVRVEEAPLLFCDQSSKGDLVVGRRLRPLMFSGEKTGDPMDQKSPCYGQWCLRQPSKAAGAGDCILKQKAIRWSQGKIEGNTG